MEDMARLAVVEQSVGDFEKFSKILYELLRRIGKILENPHDYELRTINSEILYDVIKCDAFIDYLQYVGFLTEGSELKYPKELSLNNLRMAQAAIERKINFCGGAKLTSEIKLTPSLTRKPVLNPTHILTTENPMLQNLQAMFNQVLLYEDEELQAHARQHIPLVTLQLMALDRVREQQKKIKTGEIKAEDLTFDIALLMELLGWFKHKFFTWVDQPACERCEGATVLAKTASVSVEGETCRMELYKCSRCPGGAQFPRLNNPRTLLRTRRGRCGEWANCFALLCRSLGYDTRYVADTADHVWCEVFDYDTNSWLHVDPCEASLNAPLLYSHGWGKKLAYVLAVSKDDLQDVTWRYIMDHKEVLNRRTSCSESELLSCILSLREHRQRTLSEARRNYLAKRNVRELAQMMVERKPNDFESHGRISGSKEWRVQRGEDTASHTFEFTEPGSYTIQYYTASDSYRVTKDGIELPPIKSWASGVFHAKNVFRKVENDWRKAYLARDEGAPEGSISWRMSVCERVCVRALRVCACVDVYTTGEVCTQVQYDEQDPVSVKFDGTSISPGHNATSITLSATLSGGEGHVAWQHAQLCRHSLDDHSPALEIYATVVHKS